MYQRRGLLRKDIIIYKDLSGEYRTISELAGENADAEGSADASAEQNEQAEQKKEPKTIYYVSDESGQAQYIDMFKNAGLNAIVCDTFIDPHFISYLEYKEPEKLRFMRIDADVDAALKSGESATEENKELVDSFKSALKNTTIAVKAEKLKEASLPAIINVAEFSRRFSEMNAFYGLAGADADRDAVLILNTSNPVIASFTGLSEDRKKFVANQIYFMAMLSYKKLAPEEMKELSENNMELLKDYVK